PLVRDTVEATAAPAPISRARPTATPTSTVRLRFGLADSPATIRVVPGAGFSGVDDMEGSCSWGCGGPGGWSAPATSPLECPAGGAVGPFRSSHGLTLGRVANRVQWCGNRGSRKFMQRHMRTLHSHPGGLSRL